MPDRYKRVLFSEPFVLERMVQVWRTPPTAFWRLHVDGRPIGYMSTDVDTSAAEAVRRIFEAKEEKGDLWDRPPDAIVWSVGHQREREPYAVFRWVRDAWAFVEGAPSYMKLEVENNEGRRIVGVGSHGYAILEKLKP